MTGSPPETLYIAVIGDLVDSRSLADRASVQEKLRETLELFNRSSAMDVASRFLITLGDEFQGLLKVSANVSDFWWFFQRHMHAAAATRLGFGLGPLSTDLRPDALGMDGPCFHAARAAIESAHAQKLQLAFSVAGRAEMTEILSRVSKPLDRISRGWSDVQWETLWRLSQGESQTYVAASRGVARQSVHDVVRASLGAECQEAWVGIDQLVRFFAGVLNSPKAGEV